MPLFSHSSKHPFINPLNKHLLSDYYEVGTMLTTKYIIARNVGYRNVNKLLQYRMMHAKTDAFTGDRKSHGDVMGK